MVKMGLNFLPKSLNGISPSQPFTSCQPFPLTCVSSLTVSRQLVSPSVSQADPGHNICLQVP